MNASYILTVIFILMTIWSTSFAQDQTISKLKEQSRLANALRDENSDSSIVLLNRVLQESLTAGYDSLSLAIVHDMITIFSYKKDSQNVSNICRQYLKAHDNYPLSQKRFKSVILLCYQSERAIGNYERAFEFIMEYESFLKGVDKKQFSFPTPKIFLGEINYHKKDYETALDFFASSARGK